MALACDSRCRQHSPARNVSAKVCNCLVARFIAMQPKPPLTPPPKVLARPRGSIRGGFPWSPWFRPCPPPFTEDKNEGCDQKKRKTLPRKVRCSSELGQLTDNKDGRLQKHGKQIKNRRQRPQSFHPQLSQAQRALEMAGAYKNAKNDRTTERVSEDTHSGDLRAN